MSLRPYAVTCLILFGTIPAVSRTSPPSEAAAKGIDLAAMDRSVAPGDDFYAYVNGAWLQATPIPPDKASYGIDTILADATRRRTVALIQAAASRSNESEDARKIGAFYSSFMDEAGIEAKGIAPLKPQLEAIAAVADRRALARAIGGTLRADVDALNDTNFQTEHLFGVWVVQGLDDPEHNYPYLLQGGLGMPDRDYYRSNSPKMAELRKQYQRHVAAILKLAGLSDAQTRADRVFALENQDCRCARDTGGIGRRAFREEMEEGRAGQQGARSRLAGTTRGRPLKRCSGLLHLAAESRDWSFRLGSQRATRRLEGLAHVSRAREAASFLPKAFVEEHFTFHGKALKGIPRLRERWQRGPTSPAPPLVKSWASSTSSGISRPK